MNLARSVNQTLSLGLRQISFGSAEITRPPPSFILFRNDKYKEFKKQNPNLKVTEITSKLSHEWNLMSVAQKDKYTQQYRTLNEQYRVEMAKLSKEDLDKMKQEGKEDRLKRKIMKVKAELKVLQEDRPVRPVTQFIQYYVENLSKCLGTNAEKTKKLAVDWGTLTPEQKDSYDKRYLTLLVPYQKKLKEWQEKIIADGRKEKIDVLMKKLTGLQADKKQLKP